MDKVFSSCERTNNVECKGVHEPYNLWIKTGNQYFFFRDHVDFRSFDARWTSFFQGMLS